VTQKPVMIIGKVESWENFSVGLFDTNNDNKIGLEIFPGAEVL